jgi:hypothetical protein
MTIVADRPNAQPTTVNKLAQVSELTALPMRKAHSGMWAAPQAMGSVRRSP